VKVARRSLQPRRLRPTRRKGRAGRVYTWGQIIDCGSRNYAEHGHTNTGVRLGTDCGGRRDVHEVEMSGPAPRSRFTAADP